MNALTANTLLFYFGFQEPESLMLLLMLGLGILSHGQWVDTSVTAHTECSCQHQRPVCTGNHVSNQAMLMNICYCLDIVNVLSFSTWQVSAPQFNLFHGVMCSPSSLGLQNKTGVSLWILLYVAAFMGQVSRNCDKVRCDYLLDVLS